MKISYSTKSSIAKLKTAKSPCKHIAQISILLTLSYASGCKTLSQQTNLIDSTQYDTGSIYYYQPINPTTVWISDPSEERKKDNKYRDADETSLKFNERLLKDLDTETVRISLDMIGAKGNFTAGVGGLSVEGQSYVLTVDYIKYFAQTQHFENIKYHVTSDIKGVKQIDKKFSGAIPIYTGVGLRIRAEFKALKDDVDISGLPALAIAASTEGVSGRLAVQTMGITGREVTALMPIISDISISSIQQAVQSVAAIKAKLYESDTTLLPKIVGFESPYKEPALIQALTQTIYAKEIIICAVLSDNPESTKNQPRDPIYWIDWECGPDSDGKTSEQTIK